MLETVYYVCLTKMSTKRLMLKKFCFYVCVELEVNFFSNFILASLMSCSMNMHVISCHQFSWFHSRGYRKALPNYVERLVSSHDLK